MLKKIIIASFIFMSASFTLFSEDGIEGLYYSTNKYVGIMISKLDEGYLIEQVFLMDSKVKKKFEWQNAYVKDYSDTLHFYWHTGRKEESEQESNGIIAYDLIKTDNGFEGIYYFPTNNNSNKFKTVYTRLDEDSDK